MKMQKSPMFVEKSLKIMIKKDKKYCKTKEHCHYTGEYWGAFHSICNSKCSIPKEITIIFYNISNYVYYFIIKVLAEKFEM